MIWIVVPLFGSHAEMRQFLDCLAGQTYQQYHLVIVNHGYEDFLTGEGAKATVVRASPKLWWTGAVNRGIEHVLARQELTEFDFILLHNHDSKFAPGYLQALLEVAEAHPQAVVGSVCVSAESGGQRILYANVYLDRKHLQIRYPHKGDDVESLDRAQPLAGDFLKGRGTLYQVSIVKRLGLLAERTLPHYGADHEYAHRARKAGYQVLTAPNAVVETSFAARMRPQDRRTLKDLWHFYFSRRSTQSFQVLFWTSYLQFGPVLGTRFFLKHAAMRSRTLLHQGVRHALRGRW